jgi:ABC-type bacteriocin/lantibiotic exporter with double-glycine peptidase domain
MKIPSLIAPILSYQTHTPAPPLNRESTAHIQHSVPYIRQIHANMCADACVNMLLAFKGMPHDSELTDNPRGILDGLDSEEIHSMMAHAGLERTYLPEPIGKAYGAADLKNYLEKHGPLICRTSNGITGHIILLTGVDNDRVSCHDPWRGPNTMMSLKDFNNSLDWGEVGGCLMSWKDPAPDPVSASETEPSHWDEACVDSHLQYRQWAASLHAQLNTPGGESSISIVPKPGVFHWPT